MDGAQQDGAAGCDPIAVGAILGVLRKVGLTGPRLALQIGEEADVARQVAERAGVPCDEWVVDLVKAQVKDAYDTVELEARLEGSAKTPGAQAVDDAVANITKAAQSQAAGSTGPPSRPSVEVPKRGKLAKLPKGVALAGSTGNMEEDKVVQLLYEELSLMGAPIITQIGETSNPERAKQALLGKYRASTAKRYLAYWQGFRKWIGASTGGLPYRGEQLVDYLLAREEEGMGATVPLSVGKGVAWFEKLAGFEDDQMMSSSPLVDTVVKDLLRKLEDKAPPRRRAPRMLSAFVPALEALVMDKAKEERLRAGAWVKLLKIWASLRFDDMAHMRWDMVWVYDGKLSGLLKRTKTTGGGKRVKELPFHVAADAWVGEVSWLETGMQLLGGPRGKAAELVIPAGLSQGEACEGMVMTYQEAVAWSAEVLQELRDEKGDPLIPHGWERYWTEHSE
jgi:hypothetical protein